ncbi:L-seryl-tRNA kinase [Acrasis kona]|uniref:L-seryl-tRNA kinase n=1 Tax=Acrasis kona TaxID=1008807 RepID=A0AAW2YPK2_9EUKA
MVVLAMICGLPGSGKTTLCEFYKNNHQDVIHICFDHLHKELYGDSFVPEQWKQCRHDMFLLVEKILGINNLPNTKIDEYISKYNFLEAMTETTTVLVDDNFYYQSMRRSYKRSCAENSCRLLIVELLAPIQLCISRNQQRALHSVVPTDVITSMQEKKCSSASFIDVTNLSTEQAAQHLHTLIDMATVPKTKTVDEYQRLQDKIETSKNLTHQMDILLRKRIGVLIQTRKHDPCFIKNVNAHKKKLLQQYSSDPNSFNPLHMLDLYANEL